MKGSSQISYFKKCFVLFTLTIFSLFLNSSQTQAQVINFTDFEFKQTLINRFGFDQNHNQEIEISEVDFVDTLDLTLSSSHFKDLNGIEAFTSLKYLNCSGAYLTKTPDFSKNLALEHLNCTGNQIDSLDLSKNKSLKVLKCGYTSLKKLDLSKNTLLNLLECGFNMFTSLNVSNTLLEELTVNSNPQLKTLKVDNCLKLLRLNCSSNSIDTLDLSKCKALKYLDCSGNNLHNLSFGNNKGLIELNCEKNPITRLDVSNLTLLTNLVFGLDKITSLKADNCSSIQGLLFSSPSLDSLELSNCTSLKYIYCNTGNLKFLNVNNCTELMDIICFNNKLSSLDLSTNISLQSFNCSDNQITKLDVSNNPSLTYLNTMYNPLVQICVNDSQLVLSKVNQQNWIKDNAIDWSTSCTRINITDANFLKALIASGVDLNNNKIIERFEAQVVVKLDISGKSISNVSGIEYFTSLQNFNCSNNSISSLDIHKNKAITSFNCSFNPGLAQVCLNISQTYISDIWVKNPSTTWSIACAVVDIPDEYLRYGLINSSIDKNGNKKIEATEALEIKELDLSSRHIRDLTGLSDFRNLTSLNLYGNGLITLDVSKFIDLQYLDCRSIGISQLDLTQNKKLVNLNCNFNDLTSLDLIQNTKLEFLDCGSNAITVLDVRKNVALSLLSTVHNKIEVLDLSSNNLLEYIECRENLLSDIVLENCEYLKYLDVSYNRLKSLNISKNLLLRNLKCTGNFLTSLNLSKNLALNNLYCDGNILDTLDISTNLLLNELKCGNNQLNYIQTGNAEYKHLSTLICFYNNLKTLDASRFPNVGWIDCSENKIAYLDISKNIALERFEMRSDNPSEICINTRQLGKVDSWVLGIFNRYSTACQDLTSIVDIKDSKFGNYLFNYGFDNNNDGFIQKTEAASVNVLYLNNLEIKELSGIADFTLLDTLYCNNNNIDTLDLSKNANLKYLDCSFNKIKSLVLNTNSTTVLTRLEDGQTKNSTLKSINCSNNNLSILDVSNIIELEYLNCYGNQTLSQVCINDNQVNKTMVWEKGQNTQWSTTCRNITGLDFNTEPAEVKTIVRISTPLGQEIKNDRVTNGIYIFQYSDGSNKKVLVQ